MDPNASRVFTTTEASEKGIESRRQSTYLSTGSSAVVVVAAMEEKKKDEDEGDNYINSSSENDDAKLHEIANLVSTTSRAGGKHGITILITGASR
jgi:hypothetical protein